jgi:hypothetical protein
MQAVADNALRFCDHACNNLGGRHDRVDQAGILANEKGGMVRIACPSRCLAAPAARAC